MKKLLALLTTLTLLLCCAAPALAEENPRLFAAGYMAALDAIAGQAGVTLTWYVKPDYLPGYTLYACETLQARPTLICQENTVVMLCTSITYDPAEAPLEPEAYLGQFIVALTPILTSQGMTVEEALDALLPLVNEDGFVEQAARVSQGGDWRFTILGYEAALLYLHTETEDSATTQLCLYVYTAPDLMPGPTE